MLQQSKKKKRNRTGTGTGIGILRTNSMHLFIQIYIKCISTQLFTRFKHKTCASTLCICSFTDSFQFNRSYKQTNQPETVSDEGWLQLILRK